MKVWIFAALLLFVIQTWLPSGFRYLRLSRGAFGRLRIALGPRDDPPPLGVMGGRAERALQNMHEALPVFLAISFLHVAAGPSDRAIQGAGVFVVSRVAYVGAYLSGVPGVRSAIWISSWVGLGMMIGALLCDG